MEDRDRRTTTSAVLINQAFMVEWLDRSHSGVKSVWQPAGGVPNGPYRPLRAWGERFYGMMRQNPNSWVWVPDTAFGSQTVDFQKRTGSAHVPDRIPTKTFNQFSIESFQTKESESLNAARCALQPNMMTCAVQVGGTNQWKSLLGFN